MATTGTLDEIRRTGTFRIVPWPDPLVDRFGHDPRSGYVERFWLPVLGPSATLLLRLLASTLDASPDGCALPLAETAHRLGLGRRVGPHSPLLRTLARCLHFEMARPAGEACLAVRRRLPPLARRQLACLSPSLLAEHRRWVAGPRVSPPHDDRQPAEDESPDLRHNGRRLALSLLRLGEGVSAAEQQLVRWRYHPALARECCAWALRAHQLAGGGDG